MKHGTTICLTGATGYIGSRLAPHLLDRGYRLRCLTRSKRKLEARPWTQHVNVEIVECDGSGEDELREAMRGCEVLYYLIHSMIVAGASYARHDQDLAQRFAKVAESVGVERIVYLGGLGELGAGLSQHLVSRREVESALASTRVPVTVLRAAMIIGSGSASFEILRYIVERLPIMLTPKWVSTESQPIAVRNVLSYLVQVLDHPDTAGETLDIGGSDIMTYAEIINTMAVELGLPRRTIITVPVLTPKLSSYWIHLVTPAPASIARPLAEGLKNRVVCRDDRAVKMMPQELLGVKEAIQAAFVKRQGNLVDSSWADAGIIQGDPDWTDQHRKEDSRTMVIPASPEKVFEAVCEIGGENGWYGADWLWHIRGWMDKLVGGPGLQRGRRNEAELNYGDPLDFWRVQDVVKHRRLLLMAEMKLPGNALLEFKLRPEGEGTRLTQTAYFFADGLLGLMYWYSVVPLHFFVFDSLISGIHRSTLQKLD